MTKKETTRINVTLPASTKKALERLAGERGTTLSGTVKEMIIRELLIEAHLDPETNVIIGQGIDGRPYITAERKIVDQRRLKNGSISGLLPKEASDR